jgi:predicted N-acetyltransferase YhbS
VQSLGVPISPGRRSNIEWRDDLIIAPFFYAFYFRSWCNIPNKTWSRNVTEKIELRTAKASDIPACATAMYEAFRDIAERHNFPPDFPSAEVAGGLLNSLLGVPDVDAFVAEQEGTIAGSIFVSRRSPVGGISIVTVDPKVQNRAIGRQLMLHGMECLDQQGHTRQQLIQAGYHSRSLCLYAKLGFIATDLLSNMYGGPITEEIPGRTVRQATEGDADACNALCRKVHGFDRAGEVAGAISQGKASVVESDDGITGYTTGVGFVGHGVGASTYDLKALIASVDEFIGPGVLIPTTNGDLFRWCLENGLRVSQQLTLMDTSPAGPPDGAYWPSVLC